MFHPSETHIRECGECLAQSYKCPNSLKYIYTYMYKTISDMNEIPDMATMVSQPSQIHNIIPEGTMLMFWILIARC